MNDWNEGYFTDTAYTYGYFRDVSPVFQNFCLLASPLTGCGVGADRSERLFLHFMRQGQHKAEELAQSTWSVLSPQGYKLGQQKDGVKTTLQTDAENIAALTELAESFFAKRMPILKALQIA